MVATVEKKNVSITTRSKKNLPSKFLTDHHFYILFHYDKKSRFLVHIGYFTAQKMKFSTKDFFSKSDQIHSFLRIWLHLLKNSLMANFILCAVLRATNYPILQIL